VQPVGELNKKPTVLRSTSYWKRVEAELEARPILDLEVMPPSCSAFNHSKTARS
jgi:hypothetical protein